MIKADIGKVADIQRMFETIKSQFGGLDIFVSNARATLASKQLRSESLIHPSDSCPALKPNSGPAAGSTIPFRALAGLRCEAGPQPNWAPSPRRSLFMELRVTAKLAPTEFQLDRVQVTRCGKKRQGPPSLAEGPGCGCSHRHALGLCAAPPGKSLQFRLMDFMHSDVAIVDSASPL